LAVEDARLFKDPVDTFAFILVLTVVLDRPVEAYV